MDYLGLNLLQTRKIKLRLAVLEEMESLAEMLPVELVEIVVIIRIPAVHLQRCVVVLEGVSLDLQRLRDLLRLLVDLLLRRGYLLLL